MATEDKPPIFDINAAEDPEIPYSGGGSNMFANEDIAAETAKKQIEAQRREKNELLPISNVVLNFIKAEREAIADIRSYIKTLGDNPTAKEIQAEYRARELYLNYLARFEMGITLRLTKLPNRYRRAIYGTTKRTGN